MHTPRVCWPSIKQSSQDYQLLVKAVERQPRLQLTRNLEVQTPAEKQEPMKTGNQVESLKWPLSVKFTKKIQLSCGFTEQLVRQATLKFHNYWPKNLTWPKKESQDCYLALSHPSWPRERPLNERNGEEEEESVDRWWGRGCVAVPPCQLLCRGTDLFISSSHAPLWAISALSPSISWF